MHRKYLFLPTHVWLYRSESYQNISSNTSNGKGWGLNTIKSLSFTGVSGGAFFLHDGSATSVWICGTCDPELPPNCCGRAGTERREIRSLFGDLGPRAKRYVTAPWGLYNSSENVFFVNKQISYLLTASQRSHSHTLTRNCCWLGSLHTIDVSCDVTIWVAIFLRRLERTTDSLQKTRNSDHLKGDLLGVTSSPEVNCLFLVDKPLSCPPTLAHSRNATYSAALLPSSRKETPSRFPGGYWNPCNLYFA